MVIAVDKDDEKNFSAAKQGGRKKAFENRIY